MTQKVDRAPDFLLDIISHSKQVIDSPTSPLPPHLLKIVKIPIENTVYIRREKRILVYDRINMSVLCTSLSKRGFGIGAGT